MSALEKPSTYIAIILLIVTVIFGTINFGIQLNNKSDITLDQDSQDYISRVNDSFSKSGFYALAQDNDLDEEDVLKGENDTKVPLLDDVLAQVKFAEGYATKFSNTLYVIYDAPSLLIELTGLELSYFRYVVNTIIVGLYVYFIIMIKKFLFGS